MIETLSGFRRRLVARLALVGALASLLAGLAAFFIQTERLEHTLVDQAALEARNLGAVAPLTAGPTDTLRAFLASHAATNRDFFVLAEAYDQHRSVVGEVDLPEYSFVEKHFDRASHRFPAIGETWYAKALIDGAPFLQVMVPLHDGATITGWFEGIYRISPETTTAIRTDVLQITGLVIGAVLLTAAILYPLMSSLQGHIVAAAQNLLRANIDTLKVLGNAIAKRDSDTNAHNYRVTVIAVRIAESMGLEKPAIRSLIKGAFLHDVGKIAVPDAILMKPGKLDVAEFTEMKTHVTHGLDIISASQWLVDAAEVVGGHHEKVDGSGYPQGLEGRSIPVAARIFAVADVYDALTSTRPYKAPMPLDKTMAILEAGRDRHFDGRVLDVFRDIVPRIHAEISGGDDHHAEALANDILSRYFNI